MDQLDSGIAVHRTDKKIQSISEAREATKKKMHHAAQACSSHKRRPEATKKKNCNAVCNAVQCSSFVADVIFAKGMRLKMNIFCVFFCFAVKQHLVLGINYFRK